MSNLAQLLQSFGVSVADVEKASAFQRKYGGQLEHILVSMGSLSSETLPDFYAKLLSLPTLNDEHISDWTLPEQAKTMPVASLTEKGWMPFALDGTEWKFVTIAPLNKDAQEIVTALGVDCKLVMASAEQFNKLAAMSQQQEDTARSDELTSVEEARLRELASEAPTVNLLNALITKALRQRASDMHIEPSQGRGKVRFRIDGVLQDIDTIPAALVLPVTTRLKILSNMDIAEKRRPQDGKIEMRIGGIELDIRVSALPLNDGESVVMRFLRKDAIRYDMEVLGIAADIEQKILQDIKTTAGVVLLTGPTGSGKTTSLYTFLNKLNTPGVKIITLEDPVEYQLDGINQVQVQSDIGFDFAAGLRSIVRQDPDIIMLGEIRDKETAAIAMQSALTGHLVFSTVHTNDAPSAYTRLLDLGVEEFLLNAALVSIVAQRLVRRLCPDCAIPAEDATALSERYQLQQYATALNHGQINLFQAAGCERCNHTGYKGRLAIIEYLRCTDEIKAIPKDQNFIQLARAQNRKHGGRTLLEDGLLKALQGTTTIEEVLRVAG
ncbi:GspE/PulE family protein [Arsukibacterium indicum]|uniref:Type II/IV secretion system protein n=1 Tax=Arsukibacterium indicum TaxID=2848612 RepID=A0ABS6MG57_9GAMM|nr:type II/IV secretion system protein [Arsukibacterium indicum]MBV2127792.1 type II/IV secretion system protein [Arsukibacterium indicum]